MRVHAQLQRLRETIRALGNAAHLRRPRELGGLVLLEHVHLVRRLALLGDDDLLVAVDDEIASLVVYALADARQSLLAHSIEIACLGVQHRRNLRLTAQRSAHGTETAVGSLARSHRLLASILRILHRSLCHLNVYSRSVRDATQSRLSRP